MVEINSILFMIVTKINIYISNELCDLNKKYFILVVVAFMCFCQLKEMYVSSLCIGTHVHAKIDCLSLQMSFSRLR